MTSDEDILFEKRKSEHIAASLNPASQGLSQDRPYSRLKLFHQALPEVSLQEVSIECELLGKTRSSPYFISSMTAGHAGGVELNQVLARGAAKKGWLMGVGSQRRELWDEGASKEWGQLKEKVPEVELLGNLGLTQLIEKGAKATARLFKGLDPVGIFIHTNPLQEAIQREGTPNFRGGINALREFVDLVDVPVVLKETGCGFSVQTLLDLADDCPGLHAVDLSGSSGTNWGLVEGLREGGRYDLSRAFQDWGISSIETLYELKSRGLALPYQIWASGGVRSGVDALKCIVLGAQAVGVAAPLLRSALQGLEKLEQTLTDFDDGLKIGLFLLGCVNIGDARQKAQWKWEKYANES